MPKTTSRDLRISDFYRPFPRQAEFHNSPAKYRLFGGAAGPGKTKALLFEAIGQAQAVPGADTLLLRRTFPELEKSLLTYFRRDVPRELYRNYNDAKHIATFHNDSTLQFGHLQHEKDVYQYQGAEFLFIGLDETTHFTLKQWQYLTSRNRCSKPGARPNMAGATNPGNVGHAWVKALWIDHELAPGMEASEYDPADYDFIRATLDDNPVYGPGTQAGRDYRKTLTLLPKYFRDALLNGDWTVFAGQYFTVFEPGRHTIRAEQIGFQPWWTRRISIDWGFEHPAAAYWHTQNAAEQNITYRELVENRLSPRNLARKIIERSEGEKIQDIYLSPDAFAQRTTEASIAEQMGDEFEAAGLPRPTPADNDRIGGWMLMYQLLETDHWLIADNCRHLIRVLPTLTRDEKNVEDILKLDGDDPADAARYGLKSYLLPGHRPVAEVLAEKITAVDPTSRAIWMRKFERDMSTKTAPALPRRWRPYRGPA